MEEMPSKYIYRRMVMPAVVPGDTSPGQGFWMGLLYLFPVQLRQGMEFIELSSFTEAFMTRDWGCLGFYLGQALVFMACSQWPSEMTG